MHTEADSMETRIHDAKNMKQLIDFKGCTVGKGMYPTDIDALIEYKNSKYIIFEVKYRDFEVPLGQRLALQRMVDDFTSVGKQAIAIVCSHTVKDQDKSVLLARCKVREIYYGDEKKWRTPNRDISVKEALDDFQLYSTYKLSQPKEGDNNGNNDAKVSSGAAC